MDPLRADDVERARLTSPGERLLQALELMEAGFTLQLQKLRRRHPDASVEELDALLRRWLLHDDDPATHA
jgi:inactivated superfamily I helicase